MIRCKWKVMSRLMNRNLLINEFPFEQLTQFSRQKICYRKREEKKKILFS